MKFFPPWFGVSRTMAEESINDVLELLNHYQYNLCRYDVKANQLIGTVFSNERENYFAVNDLGKINLKLKNVAP